MKKIKQALPRIHGKDRKQTKDKKLGMEFSNLSSAGSNTDGLDNSKNNEVGKAINHYSKWPLKLPGSMKLQDTSCKSNTNEISVQLSRSLTKEKPVPTLAFYEATLHALIASQLEHTHSSGASLRRNETNHAEQYKKLNQIANNLNFKKPYVDFLEWKAHVKFFSTRPEWRHKILIVMAGSFRKIVPHLQEKNLEQSNVEGFWNSIKLCSNEIWAGVLEKSLNRLLTPSPKPSKVDALMDVSFIFLGQIWNYFDHKTDISDRGDELEKNVTAHMENILKKLSTMLVGVTKQVFCRQYAAEATLPNLCAVILKLCNGLKDNKLYWKNVFNGYKIKLNLYDIVYSVWDLEILESVLPVLQTAKPSLVSIEFKGKYPNVSQDFDAEQDISLFSLYKALKEFANLVENSAEDSSKPPRVKSSLCSLFREFVPQWIDVSSYRGIKRIETAVKQDNLELITSDCKRSYSSTFTVDIFSAMELSWHELEWPLQEERYNFAILTLNNFGRCIQFYVENIWKRLEELSDEGSDCFGNSNEFFIAINNVEYVCGEAGSIAENLRIDNLGDRIETPESIIQTWKKNINLKVSKCLLGAYEKQIETHLKKLLKALEGGPNEEKNSGNLLTQLSELFGRMKENLNFTEYTQAFTIIADRNLNLILDFVDKNSKGTQSSEFSQTLDYILISIGEIFEKFGLGLLIENRKTEISNLRERLRIYKFSTHELIVEYLNKRHDEKTLFEKEGTLTVIAEYNENTQTLSLNILNATVLKAGDTKSYFRFKIYSATPTNKTVKKYRSKVAKCTNYSLYQEKFEIKLPKPEVDAGGLIHFWLKIGRVFNWKFVGECCLPFEKISRSLGIPSNESFQNKLPITLPTMASNPVLDILNQRKDAGGVEFSKKQVQRIRLNGPLGVGEAEEVPAADAPCKQKNWQKLTFLKSK